MRNTCFVLVFVALVSTSVLADPGVIIRERAKELRDQNNVRQGVAAPTQPVQPPAVPNAPVGPTLSPGMLRFNTAVATIRADAQVTAEQKQQLAQDLLAGAQGARPSFPAVSKLATDISAAFAEKPLSSTSRARLVQELDAVFNPAKYPQAKLEGILRDIQAIFQENGLARIKAVAIAEDVRVIAGQIQKGGA